MTITSDPMFGMVMENKEICIQLIQRALPHLQLKEIVNIETQKDVGNVAAKKVRYDVYVLDKDNRIFIIEMQITDRKNLPFRLRYYLGQIDQELLKPNDDYRVLAKYPTYVIMFCNFDYYNLGLARYEFEMRCTNKLGLKFGDKRTIIIFNATAKEFSKSDIPIKSFLALMNNQVDNKSKFIRQIQTEIANIKENPERRRGYMKFQTLLADAKYEGKVEEREKAIAILVKSLKDVKISDEDIKAKLRENYDLSDKEADKYLQ
ncbi:Rpn family recombination-promoting nuclease/putative transposase [Limosilactobacillus sp. RRLNB_1_1]|uniref:Rpn family recombination-promoting nuclease/putative transposase n=2 Tax=Limosilactobacillus albertensis TaxID=2759752 RepID=A0A7W3TTI2_9LACO|nr:Rpn family recombination-promoting nuclease/putative transposase [Limosilactobacillus albertensis]MBB1070582.1 Rpn family recombination-promoting nuclease/putative transposase [Limosilactobacillus albertensis]